MKQLKRKLKNWEMVNDMFEDREFNERVEELIKEYNKNEYIDIANYFDDWGELLDVVENLLKRLKEKGEKDEYKRRNCKRNKKT